MCRVFLFEPNPIYNRAIVSQFCPSKRTRSVMSNLQSANVLEVAACPEIHHVSARTDGITAWPLNLLRTRLSIPFGLRHDEGTHINRSD
jgi:hypothetical protein